jgi:hypothetical protein
MKRRRSVEKVGKNGEGKKMDGRAVIYVNQDQRHAPSLPSTVLVT